MSQFSIGEIAIVRGAYKKNNHIHEGKEVTILEGPRICSDTGRLEYRVNAEPMSWIYEASLIKKRPPRTSKDIEETRQHGPGQWDLMPWSPKEKENERV